MDGRTVDSKGEAYGWSDRNWASLERDDKPGVTGHRGYIRALLFNVFSILFYQISLFITFFDLAYPFSRQVSFIGYRKP